MNQYLFCYQVGSSIPGSWTVGDSFFDVKHLNMETLQVVRDEILKSCQDKNPEIPFTKVIFVSVTKLYKE